MSNNSIMVDPGPRGGDSTGSHRVPRQVMLWDRIRMDSHVATTIVVELGSVLAVHYQRRLLLWLTGVLPGRGSGDSLLHVSRVSCVIPFVRACNTYTK